METSSVPNNEKHLSTGTLQNHVDEDDDDSKQDNNNNQIKNPDQEVSVASSNVIKNKGKEEEIKMAEEEPKDKQQTLSFVKFITSLTRDATAHAKDGNWSGWKECTSKGYRIGLEMQSPWAKLLLEGRKTIETRAYNLPKDLIGQKIQILQSRKGHEGVSSLPNILFDTGNDGGNILLKDAGKGFKEHCHHDISSFVECIGWCIFDRVIIYKYLSKFEADEASHLVKRDSAYGWKDGETKVIYGWVVGSCYIYKKNNKTGKLSNQKLPNTSMTFSAIVRRMRSLYSLHYNEAGQVSLTMKEDKLLGDKD
mmetsp:Transcript_3961/g.5401  ORF Transcript_3961/g.5401 Transcript_3961/m.5401 type:complete len:309 (+) Transcript_3961:423-1349(+)